MGPRKKTGHTADERSRDSSAPWRWLGWVWANLSEHRTSKCRRVRRGELVQVMRADTGTVWLEGLSTCGSVWACPFCAASKSRLRSEELEHAGRRWQRQPAGAVLVHPGYPLPTLAGDPDKGEPWKLVNETGQEFTPGTLWMERPSLYLLTRTVRHGARQALAWTLEKMKAARDAWRAHRRTRAALERLGVAGTVRAGEVTWGAAHGWHPHEHDLVFSTRVLSGIERERVRMELAETWRDCCLAQGLPPPDLDHGVDLRPTTVATYVAKWGAAQEIAMARQKRGRGGLSPWQLLDRATGGDRQAAALWREYLAAYTGQRWITWSKGLRARLLDDFERPELVGELVAVLLPAEWYRLTSQGAPAVGEYLARFRPENPPASGPGPPDSS